MSKQAPSWARDIFFHFTAGNYHQFLIDGNTSDIDFMPLEQQEGAQLLPVRRILLETLRRALKVNRIVYYSASTGLLFFLELTDESGWLPFLNRVEEIDSQDDFERRVRQIGQIPSSQPRSDLYVLDRALKTEWRAKDRPSPDRVAVIIDNIQRITPDIGGGNQYGDPETRFCIEMIRNWGTSMEIADLGHVAVLLADNREYVARDIWSKESGTCSITIPLPDFESRREYFDYLKSAHAEHQPAEAGTRPPLEEYLSSDGNTSAELAQLTQGFRLVDCRMIETISSGTEPVRKYFLAGDDPRTRIINHLADQKNHVIRSVSSGLLEPMQASLSFNDIGGLEGAQEYFRRIAGAIQTSDAGIRKTIPKGVLLVGPPGTGKTVLARALAKETGLNLVRMGNIRSMWVGESEKNLSMVLNLLSMMAPVIVFVDEIDQALGARSTTAGDSGVSGRIFQQILEFMGNNENRGKVIWIAATNRADLLDDALISRFDRIIPVLLPGSREEWHSVITSILHQLEVSGEPWLVKKFLDNEDNYRYLAEHSGRSVETVIRYAYQNMKQQAPGGGSDTLNLSSLETTFRSFKSNVNLSMYQFQTLLAIRACNDMSFITTPDDHYSYGTDDLDKLVTRCKELRSNTPLEEEIARLRTYVS